MKVLITGGSGFIGMNLVPGLIDDGYQVLNLDLAKPRSGDQYSTWVKCDVAEIDELNAEFKQFQPEIVIHMAARTDLDGKLVSDYQVNIDSTKNVLQCCRESNTVRKFVFVSSMLVCRLGHLPKDDCEFCPDSPYGESKVICERMVREMCSGSYEWAILRPTSIWGPWFRAPYRNFFDVVQKGLFILPSVGSIKRSYGFVGNSVEQIKSLLNVKSDLFHEQVYYLGDIEPIELQEWADQICNVSGQTKARTAPYWVLKVIASIGDVLFRAGFSRVPLTSKRLHNMCTSAIYPTEKWGQIGYRQRFGMEDGVKLTWDWISDGSDS